MIISRLDGGLGNQMFQYAYGLFLARRHNVELMLDTSSYRERPQHGYLLDRFRIQSGPVGNADEARIPGRYRPRGERSLVRQWLGFDGLRRYKEHSFGFRQKHLSVPDGRYLVGYWQSEKFFPGLRAELLTQFSLNDPLSERSREVAERMASVNSVAIHVRRGDYIHNPSAAGIYEHLPMEYYQRCLTHWAEGRSDVEIFVFSNDMAWCRTHLRAPCKTHWVEHNDSLAAHEDLALMSTAACCIIANSTFSWWAAWLNNRPGKAIYAPARWFRPGTLDDTHIVPPSWKVMEFAEHRAAA